MITAFKFALFVGLG